MKHDSLSGKAEPGKNYFGSTADPVVEDPSRGKPNDGTGSVTTEAVVGFDL